MRVIKYILVIIFILIAVFLIYPKIKDSLRDIPLMLATANKPLLFLLVIFQVAAYSGDGWLSQIILQIAGFRLKLKDAMKIAVLANLGNQTVPIAGGAAAVYYFYHKLRVPPKGIFFLVWTWFAAFWTVNLFFFLLALLFLPERATGLIHNKYFLILCAVFIMIVGLIYLVLRKRGKYLVDILQFPLKIANKIKNRFSGQDLITEARLKTFISDLHQSFCFLLVKKRKIPYILLAAFIYYAGTIATLYTSFLVFGYVPHLASLVFGFTISSLLALSTLMPEAPGVMEASLAGVFISLGFPAHIALFSAVLFRLVSYWLPSPLGVHFYFSLKNKKSAVERL